MTASGFNRSHTYPEFHIHSLGHHTGGFPYSPGHSVSNRAAGRDATSESRTKETHRRTKSVSGLSRPFLKLHRPYRIEIPWMTKLHLLLQGVFCGFLLAVVAGLCTSHGMSGGGHDRSMGRMSSSSLHTRSLSRSGTDVPFMKPFIRIPVREALVADVDASSMIYSTTQDAYMSMTRDTEQSSMTREIAQSSMTRETEQSSMTRETEQNSMTRETEQNSMLHTSTPSERTTQDHVLRRNRKLHPLMNTRDDISKNAYWKVNSLQEEEKKCEYMKGTSKDSKVRLFIGVMSRAVVQARAKRDAIRMSWFQDIREQHPEIHAMFMLSQPVRDTDGKRLLDLAEHIGAEQSTYNDIAILPGEETYRNLPHKTFAMIRFALSSPCEYTHVLKTDDDVYIRISNLVPAVFLGQHHGEMKIQATSYSDTRGFQKGRFEMKNPGEKMYIGKIDRNVTNSFPGFEPVRDPLNKWYLSRADFPDAASPKNIRWVSGWGYLFSRDVGEHVLNRQMQYDASGERPPWWGILPWEDVVFAALASDYADIRHHDGFKAAWDACDPGTVLKHLDNQAPQLTAGMREQEKNRLWDSREIVCSAGNYTPGSYEEWRLWRNSLPDARKYGQM